MRTSTIPSVVIINVLDAFGKSGANITLHLRIGIHFSTIFPAWLILGMLLLSLVLSICIRVVTKFDHARPRLGVDIADPRLSVLLFNSDVTYNKQRILNTQMYTFMCAPFGFILGLHKRPHIRSLY